MKELPQWAVKGRHSIRNLVYDGETDLVSAGFLSGRSCKKQARNISFPNARMLYLLRGSGSYQDNSGRSCRLKPGDMLYREENEQHSLFRDDTESWLEFFIVFPRHISESFRGSGIIRQEKICFKPGFVPSFFDMSESLLQILDEPGRISAALALLKAQELLLLLQKEDEKKNNDEVPEGDWISIAEYYLARNLSEQISMKKVAAKLGLGYESFRKKFRDATGVSPRDYRSSKRLDQAKLMLRNHEQDVKEIAEHLGFYDMPSFVRQFKKYTGTSPGRFRFSKEDA